MGTMERDHLWVFVLPVKAEQAGVRRNQQLYEVKWRCEGPAFLMSHIINVTVCCIV